MTIMSEHVDVVYGVDSHRDTCHIAVVNATGGVVEDLEITTDAAGYDRAVELAEAGPQQRVWAVEGCGSYAAGLVRVLQAAGERIVEVERPKRHRDNTPAKSDRLDAIRAAREVLSRDHTELASPRLSPHHDRLSVLVMARRAAVDAAGDATRQLHAAILVAPDELRDRFRALSTSRKIKLAANLRPDNYRDPVCADTARALRSIAHRIHTNQHETKELTTHIRTIVNQWRPDLLDNHGVGPVVAAVVLCAWAHPNRFRSDAAFKMFAGTAPITASSGLTHRHRLNPAGDRQLNRHIDTIVLCRLRTDPATRAYRNRKRAEGKTNREIRRCLRSYITRQLFRQLQHPPTPTTG